MMNKRHWKKFSSEQWYGVEALNPIKICIPVVQVLQDPVHQMCLSLVTTEESPQGKILSYLATFDKESVLDLRFSPWQMKFRSPGMLLLSSSSSSSSLVTSIYLVAVCYNARQDNILQYRTIYYNTV